MKKHFLAKLREIHTQVCMKISSRVCKQLFFSTHLQPNSKMSNTFMRTAYSSKLRPATLPAFNVESQWQLFRRECPTGSIDSTNSQWHNQFTND